MTSLRLVLEILLLEKRLFARAEKKLLSTAMAGNLFVVEFEQHEQFTMSSKQEHD